MLKSEFLESWRGNALTPGTQNQFGKAEGSSLTDRERDALSGGKIVTRDKQSFLKKLFVMDEKGNLWSIIVAKDHLAILVAALCSIGFVA